MDFQGTITITARVLGPLAALLFVSHQSMAADALKLSLPLHCADGPNNRQGNQVVCSVQSLMDMDEGSGIRDPLCGNATYDQHKGIDIRVRDLEVMNRGVAVLAMADGVVVARRDGVADHLMETAADKEAVSGRECGNGIRIDHGSGEAGRMTTQYCHMKRGSVAVEVGDQISRGEVVGGLGLSGATQFPHIHVSVSLDGGLIDPLTGRRINESCAAQDFSSSLFTKKALEILTRQALRPLLDQGFANGPVKGASLRRGPPQHPTMQGPLVYFAKFINLRAGDIVRLTVRGPKGVFSSSETKPLAAKKATYTAYTGKRGKVAQGTYRGTAQLIREGSVIFTSDDASVDF